MGISAVNIPPTVASPAGADPDAKRPVIRSAATSSCPPKPGRNGRHSRTGCPPAPRFHQTQWPRPTDPLADAESLRPGWRNGPRSPPRGSGNRRATDPRPQPYGGGGQARANWRPRGLRGTDSQSPEPSGPAKRSAPVKRSWNRRRDLERRNLARILPPCFRRRPKPPVSRQNLPLCCRNRPDLSSSAGSDPASSKANPSLRGRRWGFTFRLQQPVAQAAINGLPPRHRHFPGHPGWSSDPTGQPGRLDGPPRPKPPESPSIRLNSAAPDYGQCQRRSGDGPVCLTPCRCTTSDHRRPARLKEMLAGAESIWSQTNVGAQAQQEKVAVSRKARNPRFANDKAILHSAGNAAGGASSPPCRSGGAVLMDLLPDPSARGDNQDQEPINGQRPLSPPNPTNRRHNPKKQETAHHHRGGGASSRPGGGGAAFLLLKKNGLTSTPTTRKVAEEAPSPRRRIKRKTKRLIRSSSIWIRSGQSDPGDRRPVPCKWPSRSNSKTPPARSSSRPTCPRSGTTSPCCYRARKPPNSFPGKVRKNWRQNSRDG